MSEKPQGTATRPFRIFLRAHSGNGYDRIIRNVLTGAELGATWSDDEADALNDDYERGAVSFPPLLGPCVCTDGCDLCYDTGEVATAAGREIGRFVAWRSRTI